MFLEKVIALHPDAEGKPCVIGNCQAGWAVMMLAAVRPELFGPLIIAGSPLSYWAGVRGKNPMRYSGGLLGGSWLTALASDLGHGKFDGAWLVQNFENQNPANTLWTKPYNLYSKVDTEAPRYLGFERWWGGHVNLNAQEIQFIVDQLFVGNNLAAGRIQTSDGTTVDLRTIRSPIVVFCSKGDNITPPQQALGWIFDLYGSVDEIRSYGQTIVYTIHESVGHLGIFVSGGVAKKEHSEFSSNIDLIETLPAGLYEAVLERKTEVANPDLVTRDWVMRCEARTLDASAHWAATMLPMSAALQPLPVFRRQTRALPRVCAARRSRSGDLSARGMDAADASPAAGVRAFLRCEPDDGGGRCDGRSSAQQPQACNAGKSLHRVAGKLFPPDGRGSRCLARCERGGRRTHLPHGVRLTHATGYRRHRSKLDRPLRRAGKIHWIASSCRSASQS